MMWDIAALFRRHSADITRNLRRHGVSAETASDLTQEAFMRLLTATPGSTAETAAPHDNPRGYLHRVARNLSIDLGRRERQSPFVTAPMETFDGIGDAQPSAEEAVAARQKLDAVRRALAELPGRTRRAFELHRLEGRTIAEVGRELGLSTSRAGALIKEAYTHIRVRVRDIG
jgi:RNA polymerase sigma factor (sigma-70 family)